MNIEMRPISDIRPYENNPRQNDAAVDAVAASIQEFGFRQPIVVDTEGVSHVDGYLAIVNLSQTPAPLSTPHSSARHPTAARQHIP